MNIFKWIPGNTKKSLKPISSSLSSSGITQNQAKIVDTLRKREATETKKRIKALKVSSEKLPAAGKPVDPVSPTSLVGNLKLPLPCIVSPAAKGFLEKLVKSKKARNIIFPDGLKHGAIIKYETQDRAVFDLGEIIQVSDPNHKQLKHDFSGFYVDLNPQSGRLLLYFKYPAVPFELNSAYHQNQAEHTLKLRMKKNLRTEK